MTKNEFIQEAALRLITTWANNPAPFTCEELAAAAKNIADDVWKQLDGEQPQAPVREIKEEDILTGFPDGESIQVVAKEIARVEKEDIDQKNAVRRAAGYRHDFCQISGADVRFINICSDTHRGQKRIDTVRDLLSEGSTDFMRRYNMGRKTKGFLDKALENLYNIKSW